MRDAFSASHAAGQPPDGKSEPNARRAFQSMDDSNGKTFRTAPALHDLGDDEEMRLRTLQLSAEAVFPPTCSGLKDKDASRRIFAAQALGISRPTWRPNLLEPPEYPDVPYACTRFVGPSA